ncbi:hypothetical protein [Deinococcus roseus]|uniref:Uncharacterized protein n=1 Tax=Deinococcus roseus TaxID=392414 RepID=A0ABQ2DKD8_9DEIO|nr:hypothetical protein [Deinococcus roseus]GGJ56697.1 hypothetical protein GCM10008938_48540 [Deinococcus roseus]
MILPGAYDSTGHVVPDPVDLPHVVLKLPLPAGLVLNHFYGSAKGMQATLDDLNAFVYFKRGGWETKNRHSMQKIRSMHGNEDSGWKDQR